jgi:hypothetical protein
MLTTRIFFCIITVFFLAGCQSSFGPRALENTHPAYNQVIVNTLDQQMLLNLVRLKYRDSAFFLNINSVTASFSMGADLGVSGEYGPDWKRGLGDGRVVSPNIGMNYSQAPTISYTPLQGEEFLENILTPIPIEALLILTQSGWRIDRVFAICVERINDLYNAPRASGPTPPEEPQYKKFQRMLALLNQLQVANLIEIGSRLDVDKSRKVMVRIDPHPDYQNAIKELKSLLGIQQASNQFEINANFMNDNKGEWDIRTRSISSMLYYLSQNIGVPDAHKAKGLITITKTLDGEEFNWDKTPAGLMLKISSAERAKPDNAFVSVPYRGTWFYIADDDLNSKSTFALLKQLFSLQAGHIRDAGPTLTIPVGG